jgi:hypothetical protein
VQIQEIPGSQKAQWSGQRFLKQTLQGSILVFADSVGFFSFFSSPEDLAVVLCIITSVLLLGFLYPFQKPEE